MAFERQLPAVPPRQLTADGGTLGQVLISDTRGYKVGMKAVLKAVGEPDLTVQVKRVMSETMLLVGPVGSPYDRAEWTNLSKYTVAAGAYIYAEQQEKSKIPANDRDLATFDQEPTVAWRNVLVDQLGRYYETANPLPVRLSDGSVNIGTVNANVDVQLTDKESSPGENDYDVTRVGDGNNQLSINPDGSTKVAIVQTGYEALDGLSFQYNEISEVPNGVESTILTVAVPTGQKRIQKIEVAGTNVSEIRLKINGTTFSKKYLWHGAFNITFDFEQFLNGLKLMAGQTLTVTALHTRPDAGDFNATAWFI